MSDLHVWMIGGFSHDGVQASDDPTLTGTSRAVFRAVVYLSENSSIVAVTDVVRALGITENAVTTSASRWAKVCGQSLLSREDGGLRIPANVTVDLVKAREAFKKSAQVPNRDEALSLLELVEGIFLESEGKAREYTSKNLRRPSLNTYVEKVARLRHNARVRWVALSYLSGRLPRIRSKIAGWTRPDMVPTAAANGTVHEREYAELWHIRLLAELESAPRDKRAEILERAFRACPPDVRPVNTPDQLRYFCHGYFQVKLLGEALSCACEQSTNGESFGGMEYYIRFPLNARTRFALERLGDVNSDRFVSAVYWDRGHPGLAEMLARAATQKGAEPIIRIRAAFGLRTMLFQPVENVKEVLLANEGQDLTSSALVKVVLKRTSFEDAIVAIANGNRSQQKILTDSLKALEAQLDAAEKEARKLDSGYGREL